MELIKKVCNDNKLELEEMEDFIVSLDEFLGKFESSLEIGDLAKQLEVTKSLTGLFDRSKREYLQSVIDFIDCLDSKLTIEQLQDHLKNSINYLSREI